MMTYIAAEEDEGIGLRAGECANVSYSMAGRGEEEEASVAEVIGSLKAADSEI